MWINFLPAADPGFRKNPTMCFDMVVFAETVDRPFRLGSPNALVLPFYTTFDYAIIFKAATQKNHFRTVYHH